VTNIDEIARLHLVRCVISQGRFLPSFIPCKLIVCLCIIQKVNVRVAADALRDEAERGETKAHSGNVEVGNRGRWRLEKSPRKR
jgi:hypothetical protein